MKKHLADIASIHQGLSLAGRGAGTRPGDWRLRMVESSDIQDNRLTPEPLREIGVRRNVRTEKHLLRPCDVLVTARTGGMQAALAPPGTERTVAGITLLVVRTEDAREDLGHYLQCFLASRQGQAQLQNLLTVSNTLVSLSATSLGRLEVPLLDGRRLEQVARLAEAQEEAYRWETRAAELRRSTLRDSIIRGLMEPEKTKQEATT